MEFTVTREPFQKILARIQGVVERRNTMPILAYTLMEVSASGMILSATDIEVSLKTSLTELEVVEPGVLAVPARKLFAIVSELPEGSTIRVRVDASNRILITSNRARFTMAGLPADEFPALPNAENGVRVAIAGRDLRTMFEKTYMAMSQDDTRFTLNGTYIEIAPGEEEGMRSMIRLVATDTHRLAFIEYPVSERSAEEVKVIVPRKAVQEIRKILDEDEQPVEVIFGQNHIQFVKEEITLISKLVDGRFPSYRRVIPENNNLLVNVDRGLLLGSLKRMMVLSNEKSRGINMAIRDGVIGITTNNPEQDDAEDEILCTHEGTIALNLGFNARYLQEIILALESDSVRMAMHNDEAPVLITDPENDHFLYVLMPMRV